jgi:hypothetical protein
MGYPMYASTPNVNTASGFIPPPYGYGVPVTNTLQVGQPSMPTQIGGVTPASLSQTQQAGFTPLSAQPNYNLMFGGTTGYKNTMK